MIRPPRINFIDSIRGTLEGVVMPSYLQGIGTFQYIFADWNIPLFYLNGIEGKRALQVRCLSFWNGEGDEGRGWSILSKNTC